MSRQRSSLLGPRRMAFWQLGPGALVAAVLQRTADEPLLLGCQEIAAATSIPPLPFAPGLIECARALDAVKLRHVVALDRPYSRLCRELPGTAPRGEDAPRSPSAGSPHRPSPESRAGSAPASTGDDVVSVAVRGMDGCRVEASRQAVATVASAFGNAGLVLAGIDCSECALLALATALGRAGAPEAAEDPSAAATDALAAVSVAPACEDAAAEIGPRLAVVVGLALVSFGIVGDAER